MLDFFRRYQRYFFLFITVITIFSFTFFGTYGAIRSDEEPKEIVVGKAIDGSKLKVHQIEQLARLLGAEPGGGSLLENEILGTGAGEKLARAYFLPLKEELQSKLDRVKSYKFYTHPSAPFLNAQDVWAELSPQLVDAIERIQGMETASPGFFAAWIELYFLQEKTPADYVKRVLLYHQNQYRIPPDPRLAREDFSLFGLRTREEWFGRGFLELCAQFVINGAAAAEERGFHVTRADADADLRHRFGGRGISADVLLRSIGLRKQEAVAVWQKAVLFSRYFQDIGQAAIVDALPYEEFSQFAHEAALIDVYELPKELRLKSVEDLLAFEAYTQMACEKPSDELALPTENLSAEKVDPAFVTQLYQFQCQEVDLKKIAGRISMKELWAWQVADENWALLREKFPEVKEGRLQALEALDRVRRGLVDDWSRRQIVLSNSDWIETALAEASVREATVSITLDGKRAIGLPVREPARLKQALEAESDLYQEEDLLYKISQVKRPSAPTVLPFAEARPFIDVERFLEKEYLRLRGKLTSLFQKDGEWKELSEVRELVIRESLKEVLRAIDRDEGKGRDTLNEYVQCRFHRAMRDAQALAREGKASGGLWPILPTERTITRTSSEEWIMQQPFILQTDEWSSVYVPPSGEIVFFFLKGRGVQDAPILDQIQLGKQTLAADAQRELTDRLLAVALKKQAIVLPLRTEGEKNDDL